MIRRCVIFHGRVQGVGFLWTTEQIARRFAVTGSVHNRADGTVELIVEGEVRVIDEMVAAVNSTFSGQIDNVETTDMAASGEFPGFRILRYGFVRKPHSEFTEPRKPDGSATTKRNQNSGRFSNERLADFVRFSVLPGVAICSSPRQHRVSLSGTVFSRFLNSDLLA